MRIQPEAKILHTTIGRFVGFRLRETRTGGYSYHYYPLENGGQLGERIATIDFVSRLLSLPKPKSSTNYLAKFYDPVWDEAVDMDAVRKLRAAKRL